MGTRSFWFSIENIQYDLVHEPLVGYHLSSLVINYKACYNNVWVEE